MLRSDAEELLRNWQINTKKVFKYVYPLAPDEYVVYCRESQKEYSASHANSTYKLEDLTFEEFARLLIIGELIYFREFGWGTNTTHFKTNSCNCGSWILRDNAYLHDPKCPCHRYRE